MSSNTTRVEVIATRRATREAIRSRTRGEIGIDIVEQVAELRERADVGLLAGDEVGHRPEAVLEIVDPHLRRLAIGDRAEMAGDAGAAAVRGIDRALQLVAAQHHIGLERVAPTSAQ